MSAEASGSSGPARRVSRLDDDHLGTEAPHDLPDLEADGAATDDEQGRRHRLGRDRVPVDPVRGVLEHGRDEGPLPGGEHEGPPGRERPAADLDRVRGRSTRALPRTKRPPLPFEALDRGVSSQVSVASCGSAGRPAPSRG